MIERKRANFVLNKAAFAGVASGYDEKGNAVQNEICRLQPIDEILDRLLYR
jgi:hypothetical protein